MTSQCGETREHEPHDDCAGLSAYDVITRVGCPDCQAAPGAPCMFGGTDQQGDPWPATAVHGSRRDLALTERGTCKLCGLLLLRKDGRVWHPEVITTSCPQMPDPGTDWNGYARAVQAGTVPGEPGVEAFIPEDELPIDPKAVAEGIVLQLPTREGTT